MYESDSRRRLPRDVRRPVSRLLATGLLAGAGAVGGWLLHAAEPAAVAIQNAAPAGGPGGGDPAGMMNSPDMLLQGLRSVEGCLQAEAAQWTNGKATIAAWFRDVDSVKRWYAHPMHRAMMGSLAVGDEGRRPPLEHVEPDAGPILVLATITPARDAASRIEGIPMPISQISIELFEALPGGASVNGRLAPEGFVVPHHRSVRIGGEAPAAGG